jgi:hypothetical protein
MRPRPDPCPRRSRIRYVNREGGPPPPTYSAPIPIAPPIVVPAAMALRPRRDRPVRSGSLNGTPTRSRPPASASQSGPRRTPRSGRDSDAARASARPPCLADAGHPGGGEVGHPTRKYRAGRSRGSSTLIVADSSGPHRRAHVIRRCAAWSTTSLTRGRWCSRVGITAIHGRDLLGVERTTQRADRSKTENALIRIGAALFHRSSAWASPPG